MPEAIVDAMLELAQTGPGDNVIDLRSGDGRIPIHAVTRVVAHDSPFPDWKPERYVETDSLEKLRPTGQTAARIYLYPMAGAPPR